MNNEIKEILDKLKKLCYDDYCLECSVDYIERKEEKILLDYITKLQEENERLRKQLQQKENDKLQQRIDNAIEYIGNGNLGIPRKTRDKFIKILKGDSSNE